jgi:hypothetical protein
VTFPLGARVWDGEAFRFLVGRLNFAFQATQVTIADRYRAVALTATALAITLIGHWSPRYIGTIAPAYMRLECRVVNRRSGRRNSAVTARRAKRVEACVLATQEGRGTSTTFYGVDKRIKALTGYVRLGRVLEGGRGTGRRRGRREWGERGRRRRISWILRSIVTWGNYEGSETAVKGDRNLIQGLVVGREDTNRLCAASPVRELSIRPAWESEHSGPGESDMACRTIRIEMGQGFERIVRVTAGWTIY